MYPRTNYEMTQADLDAIFKAIEPVPMIMLQCGGGRSQQDRANDAWGALGKKMGFDHMTVQPDRAGRGDRFFTAIPSETDLHRAERLTREAEEKRLRELADLDKEIAALTERRATLVGNAPNV